MRKNIEQKQVVAHIDYHNNLIFWILDTHIGRAVSNSIDRRHERNWDEYCKLFSELSAKWIDDYDWVSNLGYVMPKEYFEFRAQQRESLKEYLNTFYQTFDRLGNMLYGILCHIISKFEKVGKLENAECQSLVVNFEFAKQHLKNKFPNEWKKFRTFAEFSTTQEEIEKVLRCPECNSEDITSYDSLKWRCKNCNKYFLKNPRKPRKIESA
jgi:hypothetical protein